MFNELQVHCEPICDKNLYLTGHMTLQKLITCKADIDVFISIVPSPIKLNRMRLFIYLSVHIQGQASLVSKYQVDDALQNGPQEGVDAEH